MTAKHTTLSSTRKAVEIALEHRASCLKRTGRNPLPDVDDDQMDLGCMWKQVVKSKGGSRNFEECRAAYVAAFFGIDTV